MAAMTDEEVFGTPAAPPADPNSWSNTAKRVVTGAVTGIPDALIGIGNAAVRASGGGGFGMAGVQPGSVQQAPYLGQRVNAAIGGQELPQDASTARRLLEGAASTLLGGGASGVVRAAAAAPTAAEAILPALGALGRTTVLPTLGSHYGGEVGGYVGDKLGDAETGALLGSIVGGVGASAAPGAIDRYRHNSYADQAKPNAPEIAAAARRQDVQPTAGMLGNSSIVDRERQLSGAYGARGYIEGRRRTATEQISDAIDRAATARGSTDPSPTRGSIGYDAAEVARVGAEDQAALSSRGQQQLMTRIGPRTDTDVSGILAAMERIRGQTDPGTAAPIDARVNTMRQMLPTDPEGNVIGTNVPYERVKDWRTNLRERSQNADPVPGRFASQIYDEATGAMRGAGESQGVPGHFFDTVQGRTARIMGEGGPHEQLSAVAEREPSSAYQYLKGGETNPQRLRVMQATGNPAMDRIFGDYLRMIGNDTFNNPNQSAAGPRQYATRIESMHPEALDVIAGPQGPGTPREGIADTATLARALNYPTSGAGLTKATGGVADNAVRTMVGSEALGHLGASSGIPGGGSVGRVLGAGIIPGVNYLRARGLEGRTAINAMSGGAAPPVMSIQDLAAALTAASSQRGPVNGVPR
jgi:hypothetical protein